MLTGVTGLAELVGGHAASSGRRTSHRDLAGLLDAHPSRPGVPRAGRGELGGWSATVDDGRLDGRRVTASPDDWWRAVAAAAWEHLDRTGDAPDTGGSGAAGGRRPAGSLGP